MLSNAAAMPLFAIFLFIKGYCPFFGGSERSEEPILHCSVVRQMDDFSSKTMRFLSDTAH